MDFFLAYMCFCIGKNSIESFTVKILPVLNTEKLIARFFETLAELTFLSKLQTSDSQRTWEVAFLKRCVH